MTIKAFLATDSNDDTYMYFIDDVNYLQRDYDGDWEVSDEYEKEWECVDLSSEYDKDDSFGMFKEYVESELKRIHVPTKDEDPVEIEINLSLSWY